MLNGDSKQCSLAELASVLFQTDNTQANKMITEKILHIYDLESAKKAPVIY